MKVECIANITVRPGTDRNYVQGVTVFPLPGFEFSFENKNGQEPAPGTYSVDGILEEVSGTSGKGKPFRFNKVTGTLTPGAFQFTPKSK